MDWKNKRILGIPLLWAIVLIVVAGGASAAIYYGMSNEVTQTARVERPVTLEIEDSGSWGLTSSWTGTGREWTTYEDDPLLADAQKLNMRNSVFDSASYMGFIEVNVTGTGLVDGEIETAFYYDVGLDSWEEMSVSYDTDHYLLKTVTEITFNGQQEGRVVYIFWSTGAYSEGADYLATAVLTPT